MGEGGAEEEPTLEIVDEGDANQPVDTSSMPLIVTVTRVSGASSLAAESAVVLLAYTEMASKLRRVDLIFSPCSLPALVLLFLALSLLSQVGKHNIVDATPEEEAVASATLSAAIRPTGSVTCVSKGGREGVHPSVLLEMLAEARVKAAQLHKSVDEQLKQLKEAVE